MMSREADARMTDSGRESIYRGGGIGAVLAGVITLVDLLVFVVWPQPSLGDTIGWFALFQSNALVGLLDLDVLGIFGYVLLIPALFALYLVLRRTSPFWMAVSTVLTIMGITVYFASNTAFPLLSLSNQYAAATTDGQRSMILASGQALLAIWSQTAFSESFILISAALLIPSVIMLRSAVFSRKTAWVGMLANGIGLAAFVQQVFLPFPILAAINPVLLGIWFILVGRTFYRLAVLEPLKGAESP